MCKCPRRTLRTWGPRVQSSHAGRSCLPQKSQTQCPAPLQSSPSAHDGVSPATSLHKFLVFSSSTFLYGLHLKATRVPQIRAFIDYRIHLISWDHMQISDLCSNSGLIVSPLPTPVTNHQKIQRVLFCRGNMWRCWISLVPLMPGHHGP